jgi:hypothetical protein
MNSELSGGGDVADPVVGIDDDYDTTYRYGAHLREHKVFFTSMEDGGPLNPLFFGSLAWSLACAPTGYVRGRGPVHAVSGRINADITQLHVLVQVELPVPAPLTEPAPGCAAVLLVSAELAVPIPTAILPTPRRLTPGRVDVERAKDAVATIAAVVNNAVTAALADLAGPR